MTKSTKLTIAEVTPPSAVNPQRAARYHEFSQNEDGSEHLNPVSLVADVDMDPLSLGEQMNRFIRSPDFLYDGDDDDDFDMPDSESDTMTIYEDRTQETIRSQRKKREAAQKLRDAERVKKEQEEMDRFAARYEARRAATNEPATPPAGSTGDEA